MMYVCYCCGEKFENPYEKCDRYVSRFSPEYGDTAVLVCPFCGGESFGKDDDKMAVSNAYNMDCMEAMREFPDKYFDLAVVDPPYGGGFTEGGGCKGWFTKYNQRDGGPQYNRFGNPGSRFEKYKPDGRDGGEGRKKNIAWDVAPGQEYFNELFRVSKQQIIWGGNYFALPPTRCFLIWRKLTISENFSMAMVEYAWTSFNDNAKIFECAPQDQARFHPTQKPVALYAWIYSRYAKPGYKILDTHLGSGSSRIAAYDAGLDFVGYEIDKEYFDKQEERYQRHISQISLFVDGDTQEDGAITLW